MDWSSYHLYLVYLTLPNESNMTASAVVRTSRRTLVPEIEVRPKNALYRAPAVFVQNLNMQIKALVPENSKIAPGLYLLSAEDAKKVYQKYLELYVRPDPATLQQYLKDFIDSIYSALDSDEYNEYLVHLVNKYGCERAVASEFGPEYVVECKKYSDPETAVLTAKKAFLADLSKRFKELVRGNKPVYRILAEDFGYSTKTNILVIPVSEIDYAVEMVTVSLISDLASDIGFRDNLVSTAKTVLERFKVEKPDEYSSEIGMDPDKLIEAVMKVRGPGGLLTVVEGVCERYIQCSKSLLRRARLAYTRGYETPCVRLSYYFDKLKMFYKLDTGHDPKEFKDVVQHFKSVLDDIDIRYDMSGLLKEAGKYCQDEELRNNLDVLLEVLSS